MKRYKPLLWFAGAVAVVAGAALADVDHDVAVDVGRFSPACAQFRALPADSRSEILPWQHKLSMAACQQAVLVMPVGTAEGVRTMVTDLERAYAPSIAVYRDAKLKGPPQIKLLAAYGLGMSYVDIAVRARSAIRVAAPAYGGVGYGGAAYFQELRRMHELLEPLIAGDLASARAAFQEVGQLASENPAVARSNDVVRNAILNARAGVELIGAGETPQLTRR